MTQVSAIQAQRPLIFKPKKVALEKLPAALSAFRFRPQDEHNDLFRPWGGFWLGPGWWWRFQDYFLARSSMQSGRYLV